MPYKVVTATTPLWADHQRTTKNGKLAAGTEFKTTEYVVDGGEGMLHVKGEVICTDGHMDGGWVEAKNCVAVQSLADPASDPPTTTIPVGVISFVGGKRKFLVTVEEVE